MQYHSHLSCQRPQRSMERFTNTELADMHLISDWWKEMHGERKDCIAKDSDDEKEMNNAASVTTSSELRKVMKNRRCYLDAYSNGKINNKIDDIEQFDAKIHNDLKRRIGDYFPKTQ
ncbi:hypothetical protein TNCV_2340281 [Trichonephila clavipes]|nr:hypothetical protein TNCV_2340281 [Trichonephila clavipes]